VELLHGGVRGAELEKREQSSPKHPLSIVVLTKNGKKRSITEKTWKILLFNNPFMMKARASIAFYNSFNRTTLNGKIKKDLQHCPRWESQILLLSSRHCMRFSGH
jgi:hypothetical protein